MLRDTGRRFVIEEVAPVEAGLPIGQAGLDPDQQATLQARARDLGMWALAAPERLGGARLGCSHRRSGRRKRRNAGGSPATPTSSSAMAARSSKGACPRPLTAISEASGGSDPARAIQLRAERDGDHYVLNGSKTWVTHTDRAQWGAVYACTGEPGRRDGIRCFIVETDTPGFTRTPIPMMIANSPNELYFENARVPLPTVSGKKAAASGR